MNTKLQDALNARRYTLLSVEKADPLPTWLPEGDWHRYIIGRGSSSNLEGYKVGSLAKVTEYAETITADLNERPLNGKSNYASTGK